MNFCSLWIVRGAYGGNWQSASEKAKDCINSQIKMSITFSSGGHLRWRGKLHQHNSVRKPTCGLCVCTALIETLGNWKSFRHKHWDSSIKYKPFKQTQWKQSFTWLDSHFAVCFLHDCFPLLRRISTYGWENLELEKNTFTKSLTRTVGIHAAVCQQHRKGTKTKRTHIYCDSFFI